MDFELNEEQRAFAETAHQFASERLAPLAAEWDEKQIFPKDVLREAGELGFFELIRSARTRWPWSKPA